jgi:hypothetical protein
VGRGFRGRDDGGDVNNVQYKTNQNCQYECPLYNEYIYIYILIKIYYKKRTDQKLVEQKKIIDSSGNK